MCGQNKTLLHPYLDAVSPRLQTICLPRLVPPFIATHVSPFGLLPRTRLHRYLSAAALGAACAGPRRPFEFGARRLRLFRRRPAAFRSEQRRHLDYAPQFFSKQLTIPTRERLLALVPHPELLLLQKCVHFLSMFFLKLHMFSSGCFPSLSGNNTRARNV